jgi:hypothetical protein
MQLTNQTEVILGGSSAIGLAASHFGVRCRGLMRGMTDRPARRAVLPRICLLNYGASRLRHNRM